MKCFISMLVVKFKLVGEFLFTVLHLCVIVYCLFCSGLKKCRWSISVVKPALAFRAAMRFVLWSSPFGIPTYVVLQIILACNLVKPPAFCRCILCLAISLGRCTARHVMC